MGYGVPVSNREVGGKRVSLNAYVNSVSGQDGISESALDLKLY